MSSVEMLSVPDDTETVSSASGGANDVVVDEEPTGTFLADQNEFEDALKKLDAIEITPDHDFEEVSDCDRNSDANSLGGDSTNSHKDEHGEKEPNLKDKSPKTDKQKKEHKPSAKEKKVDGKTERKTSVFDRLKRLTKFDKKSPTKFLSELHTVRIDRLPQIFVAKYLGKREIKGLFGLQHVRKPVDQMIRKVHKNMDSESQESVELPLVYVVFSHKGIDMREHQSNKIKGEVEYGLIPIDFISYGVQDIKFWRIFTFIVVRELGSRTKKMECHAFFCDSTSTARRMALSLSACFQVYKKKLNTEGKTHNFQVELRPPDELTHEYDECDA